MRTSDDSVHKLVSCLWKSDFLKGTSIFDTPNSQEDRNAYQTMISSLQCTANGHYQLPLLLKDHDLDLPDNLKMAKHRMQTLKKDS